VAKLNELMRSIYIKFLYVIITSVSILSCEERETPKPKAPFEDTIPFHPAVLQGKKEHEIYEKSKAFYEQHFKYSPLNGGFLVARNGKILFEAYNGTVHRGASDSITLQTPLHIASTTKTFTAMGILLLAQQQRLQLSDSLQKYFPAIPYKGISVQMLLNHRSGLANYMNVMNPNEWKDRRVRNEDVLQYLTEQKPAMQGMSGRQFTYCNTNYVLLALIIEQITQMKYADFLRETFFEPLGMKNTFVCNGDYQKVSAPSYRYNGTEEAITFLDDTYGDKNICSTPRDLLKWDQALYQNTMFSKETLEAAFTPYSFEKPGTHNYGLGWRMYLLKKNKKLIYHNGWWHGSNACFYRIVSDGITLITIGNRMNTNIYKVKPLVEAISSVRFSNASKDE
jgi:CubicO group peptidase (beta-lactamase class C family)